MEWATAVMFAAEAALAATLYVEGRDAPHEDWLGAAYLGADAAVTAGLFFIPERTVVTTDEVPITTEVRSDCPDGLVLAIGGDTFPIDAAGSIGEVGTTALAAAYGKVAVPLSVSFDGAARALVREPPPPCTAQPCTPPPDPVAATTFLLPEGTLTSLNTVPGT